MPGKIDAGNCFTSNPNRSRVPNYVALVLCLAAGSGIAAAQATIPDAQVEANVLKALAGASDLANESITTRTVYGTVTLSGSVSSEAARNKAENLAAYANGVQKVVDELQLTSESAATTAAAQPAGDNAGQLLLQSDGTYAPAPAANAPGQDPAPGTAPAATSQRNNPDADQALDQAAQQTPATQPAPTTAPPNPSVATAPAYPQQQPYGRRPVYPNYTPYGSPQGGNPNGAYPQQQPYSQQAQPVGGQEAGQPVIIPSGALLRVRLNHALSSNRSQPGSVFDGTIINDVVANGFVAIPRGATVQGRVIDAKSSGAVSGRGEMSIQLSHVTLGGKVYPLTSDVWAHNGTDKTMESINKALGIGAVGAIIGAIAGGGKGAAIGGGVGAAAGLGSSAASGDRQVFIPAEAIVVFHTTAETSVVTVSEQEMQRLAYGAGPNAEQPPARRAYRVYPGYYPPPGYAPYPQPAYPPY